MLFRSLTHDIKFFLSISFIHLPLLHHPFSPQYNICHFLDFQISLRLSHPVCSLHPSLSLSLLFFTPLRQTGSPAVRHAVNWRTQQSSLTQTDRPRAEAGTARGSMAGCSLCRQTQQDKRGHTLSPCIPCRLVKMSDPRGQSSPY